MKGPRTLVGRGVVAGLVGGTVLALWFLLIDLRHGEAFRTPAFLAGVLGLGGMPLSVLSVALYTVVHFALFAAVGVAAAWVAEQFRTLPGVLLGIALGFLLFNMIFYGSVWITGTDVVGALGWPRVLVGNIIAGMALFSALTAMGSVAPVQWSRLLAEHYTIREGLITGLIGAAAVAAWFLILDLVAGRLLFTPAALGSAIFVGARTPEAVQITLLTVLGYTGLHVAAFLITGLVAAGVVAVAEEHSEAVLLGAVLLFVTFEAFSIGLLTIVATWLVDALSWWSIAGANLIAAVGMAGYLYMRHPNLLRDVGERNLEEDLAQDVPARGHAPPAHR